MDYNTAIKTIAQLPSADGQVSVPENLIQIITASRKKEVEFDALLDKVTISLPARLLRIFEPILRPKDEGAQLPLRHWERYSGLHIFKNPETGKPLIIATNGHIVAYYYHPEIVVNFPDGLNELRLRVPNALLEACREPKPFKLWTTTIGGLEPIEVDGSIPDYACPDIALFMGRVCCMVSPKGAPPPDNEDFTDGGTLFTGKYQNDNILEDDQYKMAPASGIDWQSYTLDTIEAMQGTRKHFDDMQLTNLTLPIVSEMLQEYAKKDIVGISAQFSQYSTAKNSFVIISQNEPMNQEQLWLQVSMGRPNTVIRTPCPEFIREFALGGKKQAPQTETTPQESSEEGSSK